jgi:hypothetical protein
MKTATRLALLALAAPLAACGPPPASPAAPPALVDAGPADGPAAAEPEVPAAGPDAAPERVEDGDDCAPEVEDPAAAAFRSVLGALAGGSARAVRSFVPPDASLVLVEHVCTMRVGAGRCEDRRVDAERRRIGDEVLARWQDAFGLAAEADRDFDAAALAVRCAPPAEGRVECSAEVPLGVDPCRGEPRAVVRAVLEPAEPAWRLVELGYAEEILVCD